MKLGVVILAAGRGTRMRSARPKVLHTLGGRPLLAHVLATARALRPARIAVVYGHGGDQVPEAFAGESDLAWIEQAEQLGTGHAVQQALSAVEDTDRVLILFGDVPLITPATLTDLIAVAADAPLALLTLELPDPTGYGRIVRAGDGTVERIVEQRDAGPAERAIREVNSGIMAVEHSRLVSWIERLENDNTQKEYYLTDIVASAVADGATVQTVSVPDAEEVMGINDRAQLARLERRFQRRQAEQLMLGGVTLSDPDRFDLRGSLTFGEDVEIDLNVLLEGEVVLGDGVRVGAHSVIRNCRIAAGTEIREHCVIENADIGPKCMIGPFARIRPGTELAAAVQIGNFVEIKKSQVGGGSKINHLSYIGDSTVGADVNIGAGTITCNYDGANKHRTVIGDRAFIGSDTQLVAPVTVGAGATIGAGSTITSDAPPEMLTLSRNKQVTLKGWQRPEKK
jgi:bifunctional UDP-N-acetylglucosamine pyrophosphorylase/glucosamine-1-phosphate N-acetyltransferase